MERLLWEVEQYQKDMERVFGRKKRGTKDPRREKLIDFRRSKRGNGYHFKEITYVRKMYQKKFRMRLKRLIENEEYYRIRCRDYKTYGWITW